MKTSIVRIEKAQDANIIIGQSHFIKSAEDIHEALVNSVPGIKFGMAFCEASGPCLVRSSGTSETLKKLAEKNAYDIGAGHLFLIIMEGSFPINVLRAIKDVPEVCSIYCATANDLELIIAETDQGRGVLGVVDGTRPKAIEKDDDIKKRKEFLRKIGYKL